MTRAAVPTLQAVRSFADCGKMSIRTARGGLMEGGIQDGILLRCVADAHGEQFIYGVEMKPSRRALSLPNVVR